MPNWEKHCWLTYLGSDNMIGIFQTTFSDGFLWMKMHEFLLKCHCSLFLVVQIRIIKALVQITAWCRPGDKPLSELTITSLLPHICITKPQWVKKSLLRDLSYARGILTDCGLLGLYGVSDFNVGSDNGGLSNRCQATAWTNPSSLSFGCIDTNFCKFWKSQSKTSIHKEYVWKRYLQKCAHIVFRPQCVPVFGLAGLGPN